MTSKILVNRPIRQANETVSYLKAQGLPAIAAPSTIIKLKPAADELDAAFFVVTSANSLEFLNNQRRDVPLFVVGEATAEHARSLGFVDIKFAKGESTSLIKLIKKIKHIQKGVLISGSDASGKPYGTAIVEELEIKQLIAYQVQSANALPGDAIAALQNNSVSVILVYSRKNAESFLELAAPYLKKNADKIQVVCLAEEIKSFWESKSEELGIKKWSGITTCMPPHKAFD